jgi:hypothetical protein
MLHQPLIIGAILLSALLPRVVSAQVELDVPLHFTGPEDDRRIVDLADPTSTTALLSKGPMDRGMPHWAEATFSAGTIDLSIAPAPLNATTGTLLRFRATANAFGPLNVRVNNGMTDPLYTTDGLDPVLGDIVEGMICEVIKQDIGWTLTNPPRPGCPPTTVSVNDRFCIDAARSAMNLDFFDAMDHCAKRGGRLCGWDEYHFACTTVASSLTGLFTDWEWIDATSNHVHIGDQVGRTSCFSQRSQSPNAIHSTRCCYTK